MKLNSTVFKRKMAYFKDMPLYVYFVYNNVCFYRVSVVYRTKGRDSFISSSISHFHAFLKDEIDSVTFKLCSDNRRSLEINFFHDFLINCNDRQLLTYYKQCCSIYLHTVFDDFFDCFNEFLKSAIGCSRFRSVIEEEYTRFLHSSAVYDDDLPF